ncbi:MAG: cytochrome-c peroxidase [Gammaproteobacteria bacterium]|nr:cytochrome-c peroxidase [Gammaproteobacteria bacterium]MCW9005721.1 cytochrome-c peroxidase [Gammaproteobacteria bacterium]MCW9055007.1 cytochrome-c peroxidase [Gammaproteobacteria bacterium]
MKQSMAMIGLFTLMSVTTVQANIWQALPEKAPAPKDNPTTAAKVELGKTLYFDPRISSTGTVSCNSCHNVMEGGDDSRPNSMGVNGQTGGRGAPTVWNAAFYSTQFWDGRANTLEDQAIGPMTNPIEMGMKNHDLVMQRVSKMAGYQVMFKKAFGNSDMSIDQAAKAIAAYERTLITPNSPYDLYVKGNKKALTAQQVKGMNLFADLGCASCHSGPAFNGQANVKVGTPVLMKFPTFVDNSYVSQYDLASDKGRENVTGKAEDNNMFRIPTLRNIAVTAPYFHTGTVKSLDEAVKVMAKTQLNIDLNTSQTNDLVAFLDSLTGPFPQQTMPRLPVTPGKSVITE